MEWPEELDRHSGFYDPEHFRSFQADTQRTYVGVGIMIRKVEKGILTTRFFKVGLLKKSEFVLETSLMRSLVIP